MCKMELNVVVPAKSIFYKRYVDDTYVRRKKDDVDKLFEELDSYNKNINLTLEVNRTKFLDTEMVRENEEIKTQVFSKSKSCLCTGVQKFQLDINTMLSQVKYIKPNEFHKILIKN